MNNRPKKPNLATSALIIYNNIAAYVSVINRWVRRYSLWDNTLHMQKDTLSGITGFPTTQAAVSQTK